ncbi:MAG: NAD/NADP octopine/nopaline dehydrogenase family protein [Candidatus Thorarchaeota archaeon]
MVINFAGEPSERGFMLRKTTDKSRGPLRVAVIGGGHAGRGLAAYLSVHGVDVALFNRTFDHVRTISENGGIHVRGTFNGFAHIPLVTNNIDEALEGRSVVIVTVPAHTHEYYASILRPYLSPGQTLLVMPGRTGGALEFAEVLRQDSILDDIVLGEAQTFSLVSRATSPDTVHIAKVKSSVRVSAFPATRNSLLLRVMQRLPLNIELAKNVLYTSFDNIGAMLHPTPTILSAGLLETMTGGYDHYHDAISPSIGRLLERLDAERVRIARKYGVEPTSLLSWLQKSYGASGETLCQCIQSIDAYDGVGSPSSLDHRYVLEDIPTGLVPISWFGKLAGVYSPITDTVIDMACHLYERDFWTEGRDPDRLGLTGLTPSEIQQYVTVGEVTEEHVSYESVFDLFEMGVEPS